MLPEVSLQPTETAMTKGDVARWLEIAKPYEFVNFLPATIEEGVNFPTAIAIIQAIDQKGQTQGWEPKDLQLVLPATYAALTTAGLANTKAGLEALLTGSTGNLGSIMKTILPEKTSKAIKFAAGTVIGWNKFDNIGKVIGLLTDEKKIETRLLKLARLQRTILLDPAKTRALLDLLNMQTQTPAKLTNLPENAETALIKISPFSLEDMKAVNRLFNAVEKYTDSRLQIGTNNLLVKTEGEKLRTAASQLGKISADTTSAITETILLGLGGLIGGTVGGIAEAGDEGWYQIQRAIKAIKEKGKARKFTAAN